LVKSSQFFSHLISQEREEGKTMGEVKVELPEGSNLLAFRCAHLAAVEEYLFVESSTTLKLAIATAHTLEYFALPALQESL
jgi:hypothetical protein